LALAILGEIPMRTEIIGGAAIVCGIMLVLSSRPESGAAAEKTTSGREPL